MHHTPYTIHHAPYTVQHTPYTIHTIHHTPYTTHHSPYTPYTIHHTPHTIHHTHAPYTILHTPYNILHTDSTGAPVTGMKALNLIKLVRIFKAYKIFEKNITVSAAGKQRFNVLGIMMLMFYVRCSLLIASSLYTHSLLSCSTSGTVY
jgi:hypothetical protein